MAAYTTEHLLTRGPLPWDYDSGARYGNHCLSVDFARSLELLSEDVRCVPCACRGTLSCPRLRWFRVADT